MLRTQALETLCWTCWTWPGPAPKIPKTSFSATFSGSLLSLTWLCTKASQTFSGTFGTWPGACTSPHRSYSGLFDPISLRCWGKTNKTLKTLTISQLLGPPIGFSQYHGPTRAIPIAFARRLSAMACCFSSREGHSARLGAIPSLREPVQLRYVHTHIYIYTVYI